MKTSTIIIVIILIIIIVLIGVGLIIGLLYILKKPYSPSSGPPNSPSSGPPDSPSSGPPNSPSSSVKGIWYTNSSPYNLNDFQTASSYCTDNGGTLAPQQALSDAVSGGWNAYCDVGFVSDGDDDDNDPVYFSPSGYNKKCSILDQPGINEYTGQLIGSIRPPIGVYCIGDIPSNVYQSSPSVDCLNYTTVQHTSNPPSTSCYDS